VTDTPPLINQTLTMEFVVMRHKPAWLWLEALLSLGICFFNFDNPYRCRRMGLFRSALATSNAPRPIDSSPRQTIYDFARMTFHEARGVEGKRIAVSLRIDSEPMDTDDFGTMFICRSEDNLARSVCFPIDRTVAVERQHTDLNIEGRLEIRFHDSWTVNGQVIPSYMELRLTDAEVIKP
jgi:hypothetical protein